MSVRRSLPVLIALGLAGVGLALPTTAQAADSDLSVVDGLVRFSAAGAAWVDVDYSCPVPTGSAGAEALSVRVDQQATFTESLEGAADVTCDGTPRSATVQLRAVTGGRFSDGAAVATLSLGAGVPVTQGVQLVGVPAPPPRPVVTEIRRVTDGLAPFDSPEVADLGIEFLCTNADGGSTREEIEVVLRQSTGTSVATATGVDRAFCDDNPGLMSVRVVVTQGTFVNGTAEADVRLRDARLVQQVRVTGLAEPPTPQTPVALTVNARPEPARKGKTISVTGTVRAGSAGLPRASTVLELKKDGGRYQALKTVVSDGRGRLSTEVKAQASGSYRFRFAGSATVAAGSSPGDHVDVIPVPRAYPSCAALAKVYPHGVGRAGAKDKGGHVSGWTVDSATYARNTRRDRDRDGIACER